MKIKIIVLIVAFVTINNKIYSCDICGCSVASSYLGVLPKHNVSLVGLKYSLTSFRSFHPKIFSTDVELESTEHFNNIELWTKYHLTPKLQILGFISYQIKSQSKSDGTFLEKGGIGDISTMVAYQFIKANNMSKRTSNILNAGIGVKFPTGSFNEEKLIAYQNVNLYPGSGSIDIIGSVNFISKIKKVTVNNTLNYLYKNKNSMQYKFGNNLNVTSQIYYTIKKKKVAFMPNISLSYSSFNEDIQNVSTGLTNVFSGGDFVLAMLKFDLAYKNIYASAGLTLPVYSDYAKGNTNQLNGFTINVNYLFSKNKKIKNEK